MATITYAGHAAGTTNGHRSLSARIAGFFARLERAHKARRDFDSLRGASDHLLADIGVTRSQLNGALAAPFWVDPSVRLTTTRQQRGQ